MTNAQSAAEGQCQTMKNKLEKMGQGSITVHWDDIEETIITSIKGTTEVSLSQAMGDIRKGLLQVWGIWQDKKRRGLMLTRAVNDGYAGHALLVYAMHGDGIGLDDWQDIASQLADAARGAGFRRIVALTDSERVLAIVRYAGWTVSNYCMKDL